MLFIPQISFPQSAQLTRKEIMEAVCKVIADTSYINVHVSVSPLMANTTIATIYKPFSSPANKSWFVFIDEHPFESWWHSCKYVFIDFETHDIIKFDMRYPPVLSEMRHVKEMVAELEDVSVKPALKYRETTKNTFTSSNEWAIIIKRV